MDEAARTGGQAVGEGARGPDEIRHDIEQTREQLGETVEALAAKTDIKAQAKAKVDGTKQRARAAVESTAGPAARLRTDPRPFVLVAVVAAGLLVLWSR